MMSGPKIVRSYHDEPHALDSRDGVVGELQRHGYVADTYSTEPGGGVLFRHAAAPSLIVHDDGRIELPSGQPMAQSLSAVTPRSTRIRWSRTLLFLALLGMTVFLGLIVTALIVG